MGLIIRAESSESTFKPLEEGTHAAVCTWLVYIGPQKIEWQGGTKIQPQLKLRFEVPAERAEWTDADGNAHEGPAVIWATATNSLHEMSKLRGWLASWRGRDFTKEELDVFDLRGILGTPCMISVIHRTAPNGKTYANITNISKLTKGLTAEAEGELVSFDFDHYTEAEYAALPKWLQRLVDNGKEVRYALAEARHKTQAGADFHTADHTADRVFDDDIPF